MEKLKEKNKHDHLFTKILKVSIFALVMLAPMFAVAAKCMYVALNKNAKDNYSNNSYNQHFNDNDMTITLNKYEVNNEYVNTFTYIKNNYNSLELTNTKIKYMNVDYNFREGNTTRILYGENPFIVLNLDNWNSRLPNYFYTYRTNDIGILQDKIIWYLNDYTYQAIKNQIIIDLNINVNNTLDNVFYYSVEQIGNEQIFSWTKNTGIYGAINTMTTGLGIDPTNNILAVLLTYWSLITAVYIIIDIVIEMFVRLTHLLA